MRRFGLFLALFLLLCAPGCRVLGAAAVVVGEIVIEGAIDSAFDDDDDGDNDCDAPTRTHRASAPRRAPAGSLDSRPTRGR